jgi:RHS repeat-associated protein
MNPQRHPMKPSMAIACKLVALLGLCSALGQALAGPTTTSLTVSPSPSTAGQAVVLTANVAGASPTGTVQFSDGPTPMGSAAVGGADPFFSSTKLLLHFDAAEGTNTFVDRSPSARTHATSTLTHDTSVPKYGTASGLFNALGKKLSYTPGADFNFGSGNFTIETWAYFTGASTDRIYLYGDCDSACNGAQVALARYTSGQNLAVVVSAAGTSYLMSGSVIASNTWVHIALARSGDTVRLFLNGNVDATVALPAGTVLRTPTGSPTVGQVGSYSYSYGGTYGTTMMGRLDEFRITKGVARYTAAFTPPAAAFPDSLVSSQATLSTSTLAAGNHTLTASYQGDANNSPSTSNAVIHIVNPSGGGAPGPMTWAYEYNAKGNLTKVTDGNGLVTQYDYDALEQRTLTTQPVPASGVARPTIAMAYDGQGNLSQVTDPRSLATTYTVTGLGSTTQLTSPDTGTTASTVNELGLPLTVTNARGKTATYAYDALNRLSSITYSAGPPTVYTWDGGASPPPNSLGKLTGISDESGTTAYSYDGLGRVLGKTQVVGPSAKTFAVQYAYGTSGNALGKLQSLTYPSGVVASYGYDSAGRPNAVSISGPAGNKIVLSGLSYSALNLPLSWSWGDGTLMQRSFDAFGRLASYPLGNPNGSGAAAGATRTVAYDAAGRITGYTHSSPGAALNQLFGYDGLDRLTSSNQGANSFGYAYDASGNRTQALINAAAYNHTVSATSNRYASIQAPGTGGPQTQNQGYDNAGHLTSDAQGSYTYSDRGRLSSATRSGNTVNYLVNALQQRVFKSGPSAIITTGQAYYVYDESHHLIGEYDANAGLIQETIFLNDTPVGVVKGDGSLGYIYSDHLDTPRVIARSSGDHAIVWRWDSTEVFGNTAANSNPNALGVYDYNPRFPGQVADAESGWHYNLNRDYIPSLGRYVQSDPIGLQGGINTYAYTEGNPISFTDPRGLVKWSGWSFNVAATAPFGASIYHVTLTSECKCGHQYTIEIIAVGPAAGIGVKVAATVSEVAFDDLETCPAPNSFDGKFTAGSGGVTGGAIPLPGSPRVGLGLPGVGVGAGYLQLGRNFSTGFFPPSFVGGRDMSVTGAVGSSTVMSIKDRPCDCK